MQTIAVGTDGTPTATRALELAIDMAERYGARLVIISAYQAVDEVRLNREQASAPANAIWKITATEDVDAILGDAVELARARGLEVTTVAGEGDPAEILCKLAEEQSADLLIVGNKGMHRRVLGSIPNSVSHRAECSVLLVKTA